jgi:hypothetical protein
MGYQEAGVADEGAFDGLPLVQVLGFEVGADERRRKQKNEKAIGEDGGSPGKSWWRQLDSVRNWYDAPESPIRSAHPFGNIIQPGGWHAPRVQ